MKNKILLLIVPFIVFTSLFGTLPHVYNLPGLSNIEAFRKAKPQVSENIAPPDYPAYEAHLKNMMERAPTVPIDTPLHKLWKLWTKNQHENKALINEFMIEVDTLESQTPQNSFVQQVQQGQVHIFIDYSNISANLEMGTGKHPINPKELAKILENNRFITDKQISASFPASDHPIWKEWQELGYRIRIANSGKELFVDDSLHAQIMRILLQKGKPGTIVLVTGDGNSNQNYSSFTECVTRAAELGWKIEIYSWKQRLNKIYEKLAEIWPNISIYPLDFHKTSILNIR